MGATQDKVSGRTKEAAGALTGDDDLKREGRTEQAAGAAKDKLDVAKDWVDDKIDDAKERINKK